MYYIDSIWVDFRRMFLVFPKKKIKLTSTTARDFISENIDIMYSHPITYRRKPLELYLCIVWFLCDTSSNVDHPDQKKNASLSLARSIVLLLGGATCLPLASCLWSSSSPNQGILSLARSLLLQPPCQEGAVFLVAPRTWVMVCSGYSIQYTEYSIQYPFSIT